MKTTKLFFLICMFISIMGTSRLFAQQINIEFFYDKLAPYGHWAEMDELGWVWQPASQTANWRPYSDGYWINTTEGWSFNADTPWAWAVYHYGRWSFQDNYGWVWVPGTVWAPAWVAWRKSDKYVGWAALPPKVEWSQSTGLQTSQINWETDFYWSSWCFVEPAYFTEKDVFNHLQSTSRNPILLNETSNTTNYSTDNSRVVDNSLPVQEVQKSTNTKITVYNIVESNTYQSNTIMPSTYQIYIYRPIVIQNSYTQPPVNYITNQYWIDRDAELRREERERRRANRQMEWQNMQAQQMQSSQNGNNRNTVPAASNNNSNRTNNTNQNPNFNNLRNSVNNQNATNLNNANTTTTNDNRTNTSNINPNFNNIKNNTNNNNLNNKLDNNEIQRRNNRRNEETKNEQRQKVKEVVQERRQQNRDNKKSAPVTKNKEKDTDKKKN